MPNPQLFDLIPEYGYKKNDEDNWDQNQNLGRN